ncbi:MAG: nitrile hydratase subunit beta [Mycobacterium sp.]|nr:nitrile hydratase subunit beta [Mycobacterium sp.]
MALVARLQSSYPEIPDAPTPDLLTHEHYLAYMKNPHDVGGEPDIAQTYENKQYEAWEEATYVLCEVLGWRGIWLSEERRRIGNVDVGRTVYHGIPYYSRWIWAVGRILLEKGHISWAELTDRLVEVQSRYADGLGGQLPQAQPKSEGDGANVRRNEHHRHAVGIGDPQIYAGKAGPARFKVGDRVVVRELPALFYTRTPEYVRGAEGEIAEVTYESPAPEEETWDRPDAKTEWFYIVRFNQSELWHAYTGSAKDTLQTEIPESWLDSVR